MSNPSASHYDVLIVGSGPSGTVTASLLARAGWSVALVEKAEFPRRKVCGEVISATNFPLFRELGVFDAMLEHAGAPLREVGLYCGQYALSARLPQLRKGANTAYDNYGITVAREYLDTILRDNSEASGATVWQPWRVVALTRTTNGFQADLRKEAQHNERIRLSATIVIAAHGSWESGPLPSQQALRHDTQRPGDLFAFKAHFENCDLPPGVLPVLAFPGGYGGLVLIDKGRATFACCIRRDYLQQCRRDKTGLRAAEAVFEHVTGTTTALHKALADATLAGPWLTVGPLRTGLRSHYQHGIFVVGNAVCETHPIIGEGITMALQSAWLLSRHLLERSDAMQAAQEANTIAREYAADWRQAFTWRVHAARLFAHASMRPAVAHALLPVLSRFPSLLSLGARLSGKVRQVVVPRQISSGPCTPIS